MKLIDRMQYQTLRPSHLQAMCVTPRETLETSTKDTMDPGGNAHNSCNSWPLYVR